MADLSDYDTAIRATGRRTKLSQHTLVAQCLKHNERNPSMQVFPDGWCVCYAGCGRWHLGQMFEEFRDPAYRSNSQLIIRRASPIGTTTNYKEVELSAYWAGLPQLPEGFRLHNLPVETLDGLGWRYDPAKQAVFIPYWSEGHQTVPFAQWRHLSGERRFTFYPGAKPTLYGKWNIKPDERLFVVEGASDCAVLERCGVPWLGVPSASLGRLLGNFACASVGLGVSFVYAGDRDAAGDKLRVALDGAGVHYRTCQPPERYKDYGAFFEAEGDGPVFDWCKEKLFE